MTNIYTRFAFFLKLSSEDDADLFCQMHHLALTQAIEAGTLKGVDFQCEKNSVTRNEVFIYSDDDGSIGDVGGFICEFVGKRPQTGTVQIGFSVFCSKMMAGEFAGGAVLIDLTDKRDPKWVWSNDPLSFDE